MANPKYKGRVNAMLVFDGKFHQHRAIVCLFLFLVQFVMHLRLKLAFSFGQMFAPEVKCALDQTSAGRYLTQLVRVGRYLNA